MLSLLALAGLCAAERPNIVLIYADDLGYGDLGCYGATAVKTPNCDRLAKEGRRFTDGHCTSATCTPSRYGMLTGQYPWRKQGTGVLPGDAGLIIDPKQPTIASVLKGAGYKTGVVGKWHLGLGNGPPMDWNKPLVPGAGEIGFDESFLIPATGDRTPCVYVRNGRVDKLDPADPLLVNYKQKVGAEPTGKENPELLKMKLTHGHDFTIHDGVSRIGWMSGGKAARWNDENMSDDLAREAIRFMEGAGGKPFFLYFATHDVHVPRLPHPRFKGATAMGPRGDAIAEFDDAVGQVLAALDRLKLAENTLVVLTSDNGPVLDDGYADDAVQKLGDHKPAGPWRGGKYSLYEGGTRVPFLVRWPARVQPGVSAARVCQLDFLKTFAALGAAAVPPGGGPDAVVAEYALVGRDGTGRATFVEHAGGFALRKGSMKYIPAAGGNAKKKKAPSGPQLYDLDADPGETKNLASEKPEILAELAAELAAIRQAP